MSDEQDTEHRRVAKLALLLTGEWSRVSDEDDRQWLEDDLTTRLSKLAANNAAWSFAARDAVMHSAEALRREQERRRLHIPIIAASSCEPFDECPATEAALVWSLSQHIKPEHLRATVRMLLGCKHEGFTVAAQPLPLESTLTIQPDVRMCQVVEPPNCRYTVYWHNRNSSVLLRNARLLTDD